MDALGDLDSKLKRKFSISYPDSHSHSHIVSHHQKGFSLGFLSSIFPNSNGQRNVYILGSGNGLVLCLFDPNNYFVCNPLTKKWVSIPPPPSPLPSFYDVTGFICSNESDSAVSYKVIRIPRFAATSKEFKVEIFSSGLGEWNTYGVSRPQYCTWRLSLDDNFITRNGYLYWMRKECSNILALNILATCGNECKLINLPDGSMDGDSSKYKSRCLGESQGSICYARIKHTERSLSVWVLQEDWNLFYKDIKFHDTLAEMISWLTGRSSTVDFITEIKVLGFLPVDKNVVILGYRNYIWAYNTRTKGYEQLRYPSDMNNTYVIYQGTLTFALTPRPSILPPVSGRDTPILDV